MRGTSPQQTDAKPSLLQRYRLRYSWLDHLVRAGQSYTANHGDHYAAAITFFSVLSLMPLLMIAFAAAGFVLAGNPDLLHQLQDQIHAAAPPGLGATLDQVIDGAIRSRGGVGIVGLLGALYSGLGWMGNLREALTAQWRLGPGEQPPESEGFLRTKVFDLLALLGLGAALMASFALTGIGTAFASVLLNALGLGQIPGARLVLVVLAVAASVVGMWLVFLWVIARLPREPVPLRSATRAAWLGAVGFELLKQAFAIYLDSVTNSPTGRLFGPVIGLMVFAYFVSRFLLFLTAWAAVVAKNQPQGDLSPAEPGALAINP
ncbi:MAG: inner membrane protein YhjD [Pseudonocardiales bacterium]|nr:inner membrane protein YhjD [Pseudonocardiales bacterium]PZS24808.1 MAG: inner membrane protein YhjD [Pseudonocardiales bacterium]